MQIIIGDIIDFITGNIPVILCSHHDGHLTELRGRELEILRNTGNDEGTRRLVRLSYKMLDNMYEMNPYLLIHKIKLDRSTDKMFTAYIHQLNCAIDDCLEKWGKCLVLDIHRFYKHPELENAPQEYGVWLGTDHRASIRGDFDRRFAASMSRAFNRLFGLKIGVYVPEEYERGGERFGATGANKDRRIITKIVSDEFRGWDVSAMQIEFYKDLLARREIIKPAAALCEAIAENI